MNTRPNILLVDDREANLIALSKLLEHHDAALLTARSGVEALELLLAHDVALALLDVELPEMDGYEIAQLMRGAARTRDVPIIFITAAGFEYARVFKGYDVGAVDFLVKPLEPMFLDSKVRTFLRLHRQKLELADALASAEQAVRGRDELISLVSHDLKNPLGAITMQVELLRRRLRDPPAPLGEAAALLEAGVARIDRQAMKMNALIGELLDVARLRAGRPLTLERVRVDLVALVRQVAEEHRRLEPAREVAVRAEEPAVVGRWDRGRLERVVHNLLSNALKYSPAGGPVRLRIARERRGGADWAVLSVADEGVGIPDKDRARVFEWFARGENVESSTIRGTGIGLAGSRQIVQQHGGSISVESEQGKGSTFTVCLPLEPPVVELPVSELPVAELSVLETSALDASDLERPPGEERRGERPRLPPPEARPGRG